MELWENEPLKPKTTMRIGGNARYFAELKTKEDVEKAVVFAQDNNLPLIMCAAGSNTIFADGTINALVARIAANNVDVQDNMAVVEAGKNLAMLINELAQHNLDLSPLTGILGTVGGALFGNAGQGPAGIWIDAYVTSVEAYVNGKWRTFSKEECEYAYRESAFKSMKPAPIIWSGTLSVPSKPHAQIKTEIERLLKQRIETQPHIKTAGSCFKAQKGKTPAWKLIDAAGLRGHKIGGVQIAEKHANFLINMGDASFDDAVQIVELVKNRIPGLEVEMRFIKNDGTLVF